MKYIKRYIVTIQGIVQGVGFRPFVYRLANQHNVMGLVRNEGSSVYLDIQGQAASIKGLLLTIANNPPPLAKIESITAKRTSVKAYTSFEIVPSERLNSTNKFISPDVATCPQCLGEIKLAANASRYGYAFTNCTNCGPRFTIIQQLPYDRCNTTMSEFEMCASCSSEYHDPNTRRFHAQPNCCKYCGPQLTLLDNKGQPVDTPDPIKQTALLMQQSNIVAIKGLGGFHLSCDAANPQAVAKLRQRKRRPHKPLAIMVKDINVAKAMCFVSPLEKQLLSGTKRPIVLLQKKHGVNSYQDLAPNNQHLGVMLPYTPLHHLLFWEGPDVLVMTSGNVSGSPIQYNNESAFTNLKDIADYLLLHNRTINLPVDDSVVATYNNKTSVLRNGRGYTPTTIPMPGSKSVLALGAHEKSTVCLTQNDYAVLSQYLGNLDSADCFVLYQNVIAELSRIYQFEPEVIVHDQHQGYNSTKHATNFKKPKIAVQHHHAHMASCMSEHGLAEPVIGIIYDGTGLGTDGTIWGGEFLVGNRSSFNRVGHWQQVSLQGGDLVAKQPWRSALGYLLAVGESPSILTSAVSQPQLDIVIQASNANLNQHLYSSMGRLFDCAASILGIRHEVSYDAQAAIELASLVEENEDGVYPYSITRLDNKFVIDHSQIIKALMTAATQNTSLNIAATRFHNTIAHATINCAKLVAHQTGLNTVVLSGGVFQNDYLLRKTYQGLKKLGLQVYYNQVIPINDNGLAVGQAAVALSKLKEGKTCV